jgi:putative hydrolase of the HAD superfamily
VRIDVVFFDAVFTLIRPDPPSSVVYAETAARFGIHVDPRDIARALRELWAPHRDAKRAHTSVHGTSEAFEVAWWRDVVRAAFVRVTGEPCSDECFRAIFSRYATSDVWRVVDGAVGTLSGLRARGVRTGVLSNYDSRLDGVLDAFALRGLFDVVTYSAEAGWEKPDAAIFHTAVRRAGSSPDRCLHVGDDEEADVEGARAAGLHAAWFLGGGSTIPPSPAAVARARVPVVHALTDVEKLIEPD